jgi:hypothetical protein
LLKTRVGSEARAQQRELFLRQVDLAVTDPDLAATRVDHELADPGRPLLATVTAVEDGGDPRPQGPISVCFLASEASLRRIPNPYLENSARFEPDSSTYLDDSQIIRFTS